MSRHRQRRGMETQTAVANYLAQHGWPYALPAGTGRNGADITGTLDIAVEVKARRDFDPLAWLRQARANADGKLPFVVFRCNGQGTGSVHEWPVLIRLGEFVPVLLAAGYGDPKVAYPLDTSGTDITPSTTNDSH